jgi:hypothetical protein
MSRDPHISCADADLHTDVGLSWRSCGPTIRSSQARASAVRKRAFAHAPTAHADICRINACDYASLRFSIEAIVLRCLRWDASHVMK